MGGGRFPYAPILMSVGPKELDIAQRAKRFHVAAWAMIAAGLVPVGLFGVWLHLVRQARVRVRK